MIDHLFFIIKLLSKFVELCLKSCTLKVWALSLMCFTDLMTSSLSRDLLKASTVSFKSSRVAGGGPPHLCHGNIPEPVVKW